MVVAPEPDAARWAGPAAFARVRGSGEAPVPVPDVAEALGAVELVGETRNRVRDGARASRTERLSGWLTGGLFALVVVPWVALSSPAGAWVPLAACVVAHAVASSVEFEIGPGSALPTTPVLVIACFLLPPELVPVVAAFGLLLAAAGARLRDADRRERPIVLLGSAWHAVGPALVFLVARGATWPSPAPALGDWPVVAAALAAQFAFDAGSSWVRNCWGLGVPTGRLIGALRFTFAADLLLAPIGLTAAVASGGTPWALLLLLPPMLLLAMLQRDRQAHITNAVALGQAYSETADRARRDPLTGLRNRLAWEEALAAHADGAAPIGFVLADVDGLKAANDRFGHEVGDRLLVAVGRLVAAAAPAGDRVIAARLGGDEFGILLPGTAAASAGIVAARVRDALATAPSIDGVVAVSASVGSSTAPDGQAVARGLLEADRELYEDKHSRSAGRS